MAVAVSDEFKAIWRRKAGTQEHWRVRYKRRYYNGSAFTVESDWKTLNERDFVRIGPLPQQIDVPQQNVFRSSQVSIFLPNTRNEWLRKLSAPSKWAADGTATLGYREHRTVVQVQQGYVLADGTTEWVTRFTGLAVKLRPGGKGEAELIVSSYDLLLERADAEKVSTTVTLEDCIPATGDGSNKAFESTSVGVDHPTALQVNGSSLTEGSGYRVSNDNQVAGGTNTGRLAFDLTTAPSAGQTVKTSLIKWLAGYTIEALIGLLCDQAGIASADRTINPVVFPSGVSSSKTLDSQADWNAGSVLTSLDRTSVPGSVAGPWIYYDDWSDGVYSGRTQPGAPEWSIVNSNAHYSFGIDTGLQVAAGAVGAAGNYVHGQAAFTQATGIYKFKVYVRTVGASATAGHGGLLMFMTNAYDVGTAKFTGYGIRYNTKSSAGRQDVELVYYNNELLEAGTVLATLVQNFVQGTTDIWDVVRDGSGNMSVYRNGTLVGTATQNTYTACSYFMAGSSIPDSSGGASFDMVIKEIRYSPLTSSFVGIFESAEQDLGATPIAFGVLDRYVTLNGGTLVYKTATATVSGGPYDSYVAVSADGQINSALKRYLKIRVEFTPAADYGDLSRPSVEKLVAHYLSSNVIIALANFRGKTCAQAVERFTAVANYERGFKADGTFFFRSKTATGTPALTATQENWVVEVLEVDDGIPDRVYNVGRVRSGGFVGVYDKDSASEAEPTSEREYGRSVLDENFEDVLLANDADIRTGHAQDIYERCHRPPLRLRLRVWDCPWLELSDIVRLSIYDDPLLKETVINDPLWDMLRGSVFAGEAQNVLARDLDMKLIAWTPDPATGTAEALLEAI